MITSAYWISPQGKVLDVGISKHIDQIIQYPESFGITHDQVKETYTKHNERVGTEGRARDELILYAINSGFIRVRFYKNSRWSITLNNVDSKTNKNILHRWAQMPKIQSDIYMPVEILDIKTGRNRKYLVKELAQGDHLFENERDNIFKLVSIPNASEFNRTSFKEFLCNKMR